MIKKYKKKNGTIAYKISTYLGTDEKTGKRERYVKSGIKTEKEAKLLEFRVKAEFQRKGHIFRDSNMKFEDVYNLWIVHYEKTVKPNTLATTKLIIKKHILPLFGHYYIEKITVWDCQDAMNTWYATYTKANNLVSLMRRIFEFAMLHGYTQDNPVVKTIRPKNTHKEPYNAPYYDKEQLLTFMAIVNNECDLQNQVMFRILAYAGLRKAEMLGLHWDDFNNGQLSVNRVLIRQPDKGYTFQSPKTDSSQRTISLDRETIRLLQLWRIEQRKQLLKFRINKNSLIFTKIDGTPMNLSYPNKILNRLIKKHDLPFINVHGFRHTHCSLLFEAGIELKEVQDRLGHSNIQTTVDIYQHISQSRKDEVADKFAQFVSL